MLILEAHLKSGISVVFFQKTPSFYVQVGFITISLICVVTGFLVLHVLPLVYCKSGISLRGLASAPYLRILHRIACSGREYLYHELSEYVALIPQSYEISYRTYYISSCE
jgi:hypothetical protein